MKKQIICRAAAIALLSYGMTADLSAQNYFSPVQSARGFNVFTEQDVTLTAGDTHGPVAAGGNLVLKGQTILSMNTPGDYPYGAGNEKNFGLVVAGKLVLQQGNESALNKGFMRLQDVTGITVYDKDQNNAACNLRLTGGTYDANPRFQVQRQQSKDSLQQPHGITFTDAFTHFKTISTLIHNYDAMSSALSPYLVSLTLPTEMNPNIYLTPNKVNLIRLTGAQLNALLDQGSITFETKPDMNTPVVFDIVAEGTFNWNTFNPAGLNESDGAYILWNFSNTNVLNLVGSNSVYGTILAPEADVNKTGANNNNGQVISKSFVMAFGEVHYHPFRPLLPAGGTPLPLSGLTLSAQAVNSSANQLIWTTLNEKQMQTFLVERSEDARMFVPVTTLASQGDGDHTYQWQDAALPGTAAVYYRVKAQDLNGEISYSNVSVVRRKESNRVAFAWPNPFTTQLQVNDVRVVFFKIISSTGAVVRSGNIENQKINDLAQLPAGAYWLLLQDARGTPLGQQQLIRQ